MSLFDLLEKKPSCVLLGSKSRRIAKRQIMDIVVFTFLAYKKAKRITPPLTDKQLAYNVLDAYLSERLAAPWDSGSPVGNRDVIVENINRFRAGISSMPESETLPCEYLCEELVLEEIVHGRKLFSMQHYGALVGELTDMADSLCRSPEKYFPEGKGS